MYWKYAGTQYKSKFTAVQAAGRDFQNITFHTFYESINNFNYSIEPQESLEFLMAERAREIRENYNYIKFFFSGGSDSTTIINQFIKNKIFIDEIIVFRFSYLNNFDENSNAEVNNYTIPWLKNNKLDKTKISIHDWGNDYFSSIIKKSNWFETKNTLGLRETVLPNIRGKNFCNLFAGETPHVVCKNNKYFAQIWDGDNYGEYARFRNVEGFFFSPKLIAKQAHILKKILIKIKLMSSDKSLVREYLRDEAVVKNQFFKNSSQTAITYDKEILFLKAADTYLRDFFKYILSTKINGTPVIRLNLGYKLLDVEI